MGKLAFAGAIGGMGQGLQQGLINMQSGIIQSGLQDERFKQAEQLADADRTFQMSKLRDQQGHELRLKQGDYAETRARDQEKMGADILKQTIHDVNEDRRLADKQTFEHGEKEDDRAITREKNRVDAELDREKNATTKQHYRDWKEVSEAIKAGKAGGHDISDSTKLAAKGLMDSADKFDAAATKALDPAESDSLHEQGQAFREQAMSMLGVQLPRPKSDVVPGDFKDRFKPAIPKKTLDSSGGTKTTDPATTEIPRPPGFLQTVEPNRPAQRRGAVPVEEAKRTAQQQLDYDILALRREIEKNQGTPSRMQALKERLANLLRQKE